MKRKSRYLTLWSVTAVAVITAMALTAATYAWFTSNREVSTSKATSRTGNGNVELQISREGFPLQRMEDGSYFTPMKGSKEYYQQQGAAASISPVADALLLPWKNRRVAG